MQDIILSLYAGIPARKRVDLCRWARFRRNTQALERKMWEEYRAEQAIEPVVCEQCHGKGCGLCRDEIHYAQEEARWHYEHEKKGQEF